jgi:hypothetical protein
MQVTNEQWYDAHSDRAYPLVDQASRLDTTGTFQLPNDVIVDARLSAPAALDAWFYISELRAYGAGLVLTIAANGVGAVATVTIPQLAIADYTRFTIVGLPGHANVGGVLVVGFGVQRLAVQLGTYAFDAAATRFLPTLVVPAGDSVTSIIFRDSFGVDTRVTGDVVLVAGANAVLSAAGQTISIGMSTGVVIESPCGCYDTGGRLRDPVRSINGVTPDAAGNISIIAGGCADLVAVSNGLKLTDTCAQPCCGAPEMQLLAQAARDLDRFLSTQANKSAELEAALRTVQAALGQ